MNLYIGCKIIEAEPMGEIVFRKSMGRPIVASSRPGYRVRYPNGYESWSPQDVFESAYRLATVGERALLNRAIE